MLRALTVVLIALLAGCGGGGGGGAAPEAPPPPTIVLEGSALDAEQIVLSWTVADLYANQAYAVTVNGTPYDVTTSKGYLFHAQPDRNYCFTVVVGSRVPPVGSFSALGPESNRLCITTPSLPPLAGGWQIRDAGLGFGKLPAIARYEGVPQYGIYACSAPDPISGSIFGYLKPFEAGANTFSIAGSDCGLAPNPSAGGLHVVTRDGSDIWYRTASLNLGVWYTSGPTRVAADAGPFSVALDTHGSPLVLYGKGGQVYLARYAAGAWTSELVGDGYIGWRSLAVAPDGSIYALIGESGVTAQPGQLRVLTRGVSGWTTAATASNVAPWQTRGSGSIVAPAAGDVRVAFRKTLDAGTSMGVGYLVFSDGAWSESVIATSAFVSPPAIAVNAAGESLIAWGDEHFDLRLSRGGGGAWQTAYIDALGRLAEATEIEVDVDGNVFILYSDADGPTKVAIGK
ncbi:MAG: hypothetical protein ROZ09_13400 [Thiobacillus sp.]|jgi:hypothetical protein|uniref:hypothetical protein n=1 Tax=Thiobacillus sp. TaxID=924 RepID=UPI0028962362|nr:hypothetical protein [Thiobacillus sp.]MDT3707813.1 hypothetical protein [Thiobacillus sp.]